MLGYQNDLEPVVRLSKLRQIITLGRSVCGDYRRTSRIANRYCFRHSPPLDTRLAVQRYGNKRGAADHHYTNLVILGLHVWIDAGRTSGGKRAANATNNRHHATPRQCHSGSCRTVHLTSQYLIISTAKATFANLCAVSTLIRRLGQSMLEAASLPKCISAGNIPLSFQKALGE